MSATGTPYSDGDDKSSSTWFIPQPLGLSCRVLNTASDPHPTTPSIPLHVQFAAVLVQFLLQIHSLHIHLGMHIKAIIVLFIVLRFVLYVCTQPLWARFFCERKLPCQQYLVRRLEDQTSKLVYAFQNKVRSVNIYKHILMVKSPASCQHQKQSLPYNLVPCLQRHWSQTLKLSPIPFGNGTFHIICSKKTVIAFPLCSLKHVCKISGVNYITS